MKRYAIERIYEMMGAETTPSSKEYLQLKDKRDAPSYKASIQPKTKNVIPDIKSSL